MQLVFLVLVNAFLLSGGYTIAIHVLRWTTRTDIGYLPMAVPLFALSVELVCLVFVVNAMLRSRSEHRGWTVRQDVAAAAMALGLIALLFVTYRFDVQLKRDIAEREQQHEAK